MLTFAACYGLIMLAIYLSGMGCQRPTQSMTNEIVTFDETARGPWAYFANEITPPQRRTF